MRAETFDYVFLDLNVCVVVDVREIFPIDKIYRILVGFDQFINFIFDVVRVSVAV